MINRFDENFDLRGEIEYLSEDFEHFDLKGEEEYKAPNKAVGSSTFRSFIMTEKADEAYNQMITNNICSQIRDIMGDIYIASPSGTRTANKIRLIRKGGGDAYQFELKINNDGTITVADNSNARGFMRTQKDGTKKFILLNTNEFFRTQKTGMAGVNEVIEWLTDNYHKYEAANAAARDRREGITPAARRVSSTPRRSQGPRNVTDMMRKHGISDVSAYLRNGGNIRDLV